MSGQHHARREVELDFVRPLVLDGAWSKAMEAITSGVVLAGLALYLGAGPLGIAFVAATPFLAQFGQFAGLRLVFAARRRRRVCLAAAFASRVLLGGIGGIALAGPSDWAFPALLVLLGLSGALSAISAVSWAFWMRDLVPQHVYGESFARRFTAQAIVGLVLTIAAGFGLSYAFAAGAPGIGFAVLFFAGAACGLVSIRFAAALPEVPMNPADVAPGPVELVRGVISDRERRHVVVFMLAWTAGAFLALPFVTVFLLRSVGLGFSSVALLAAVAMAAGLVTFRFWGRSVDRHGARVVLALAVPAAAASLAALPLVAGGGSWSGVGLTAVFLVSGGSFAAVDVAVAKLVAREAPFTGAGTFLAGAGIVRALAAAVATLVGGATATYVSDRELRIALEWGEGSIGFALSGYAFLFLGSALAMLYAWHRVLALRDAGRAEMRDVLHEAQVELAGLAPFRGVRVVGHFASHVASHLFELRHAPPRPRQGAGSMVRTRISR